MNLNFPRKLLGSRMTFADHTLGEEAYGLATTVYIDRFNPVAYIHREYDEQTKEVVHKVFDTNGNEIFVPHRSIHEQKRMLRAWESDFCNALDNGTLDPLNAKKPRRRRTIIRKYRTNGRGSPDFGR